MKNAIKWAVILPFLTYCNHPDGNKNNRHKGVKIKIEDESIYKVSQLPTNETIIDMEEESGVKFVWIEINGVRLKFIFDTGASDIFISPTEAKLLVKQGTLDENDFIGIENFQDATGRISEGISVNLKSVKIGDKTLYNVKASISDNENSPLLLGQSALERFGRIEIDNVHQRIILKD